MNDFEKKFNENNCISLKEGCVIFKSIKKTSIIDVNDIKKIQLVKYRGFKYKLMFFNVILVLLCVFIIKPTLLELLFFTVMFIVLSLCLGTESYYILVKDVNSKKIKHEILKKDMNDVAFFVRLVKSRIDR
jgi:hypothetical protein